MKTSKISLGTVAALAGSAPALAHDGDHTLGFVSTAIHWLSSPTHSLFAVIGGIAISALIYKVSKKKA